MTAGEKIAQLRKFAEENPERTGWLPPQFEALESVPPETKLPGLFEAIESDLFTEAQKWVIKWQFAAHFNFGTFTANLLEAAAYADEGAQDKLALAYPQLIEGIRKYRNEPDWWPKTEALIDR